MSRKESRTLDEEDEMPQDIDFSQAVRANTAYQFGENRQDELNVQQFWHTIGFDAELITEPNQTHSMAPDLLLKRNGTALAVCEIKSMDDFDYTVTVTHDDGTETTTKCTWPESTPERMLRLANRAMEQLDFWNSNHSLTRVFVFVNRDSKVRTDEVQSRLLELSGIDVTFWFDAESELIGSEPIVIASPEGQARLRMELGLALETRPRMIPAA